MNTQNEISLLGDQELDAVVGGMMNTGVKYDKNPQYGVPGSGSKGSNFGNVTAIAGAVSSSPASSLSSSLFSL